MKPPLWLAPVLEWFHATMAGLADDPHADRMKQYIWRRRRTSGLRPTKHAVERFRERWAPQLARHEAHRELLALCSVATPVLGGAPWAHDEAEPWQAGEVRMLVRERRVVTVLGATISS